VVDHKNLLKILPSKHRFFIIMVADSVRYTKAPESGKAMTVSFLVFIAISLDKTREKMNTFGPTWRHQELIIYPLGCLYVGSYAD